MAYKESLECGLSTVCGRTMGEKEKGHLAAVGPTEKEIRGGTRILSWSLSSTEYEGACTVVGVRGCIRTGGEVCIHWQVCVRVCGYVI